MVRKKKQAAAKTRTLIQEHSSAMVRALAERGQAVKGLEHKVTKGQLRELFVTQLLGSFLTSQFGIGSGIIINQKDKQSNQTDVIIYGKRILPPFIIEQNVGIYPAESVLATVEVKSLLRKKELEDSNKAAEKLRTVVFDPNSDYYRKERKPLTAVIGFHGHGVRALSDRDSGKAWLKKKAQYLFAVCLVGRYCWMDLRTKPWSMQSNDAGTNEETKRFIAVLLDNVRTKSEHRLRMLSKHRDWLSLYIRG